MGRRKLAFTLLEVVLSISLIALISSILLIRTKPMLEYYRFKHSCGKLEREIVFARRLAQTATTDIEFEILEKKGGLVCFRNTDEPLSLLGGVNTSIFIPNLSLEGTKKVVILITSNGSTIGDSVMHVFLGNHKKTIELRNNIYDKTSKPDGK